MNIELLLLSYVGILLHYLWKLKEALDKGVLDALLEKKAIVKECISLSISVVSASVIVYVREDISNIFVVTPIGAVIAGYAGQSILNKVLGARMPQDTGSKQLFDDSTDPKEPPPGPKP